MYDPPATHSSPHLEMVREGLRFPPQRELPIGLAAPCCYTISALLNEWRHGVKETEGKESLTGNKDKRST